jgi:hypothetical protein
MKSAKTERLVNKESKILFFHYNLFVVKTNIKQNHPKLDLSLTFQKTTNWLVVLYVYCFHVYPETASEMLFVFTNI